MDNQDQSQGLSSTQSSFLSKLLGILSHNKHIVIFIVVLSMLSFGFTTYLLIANNKKQPAHCQHKDAVQDLYMRRISGDVAGFHWKLRIAFHDA